MSRVYRQHARAHAKGRTRERILDAALEFYQHHGVGPVNVTAVAALAGVQRLTVYRHFPDDDALLAGCMERWRVSSPWPADRWSSLADPRQRLRVALDALYLYYDTAEPILTLLGRARDHHPAAAALEPIARSLAELRRLLSDGWGLTGRPRTWLEALITHALDVTTWRSLVRGIGLAPTDAARLMARAAADLARDPYA
jgi:AcrR family transcriptional regulator